MKNTLSILSLLITALSFSQIVEPNKVPEVLPPAPTVAAFMKFEEIPVGYYTGIPDVSIPIFNTKLKNGQSFDIKLGYHPASIIANEVASNCGLGWSLFAGGTISRTVKGFPDEMLRTGGPGVAKIGIYTTTGTYTNHFYEYTNLVVNNSIDASNEEMVNEYLWDVNVRGRFDTEHDLFQYNFMGYTGRFYIKKVNGNLEVVKLDKNPLKIINSYDTSTYVPNSFTIIDENGNKYLFNVTENSTFSTSEYFYSYISSFHLKEIRDINNVLLADFDYYATGSSEVNNLATLNFNSDKFNVIPGYNSIYGGYSNYNPLPRDEFTFTEISTATRKLSSITIPGQCYINIDFQLVTSNPSLLQCNSPYRLNTIEIENWYHENYKKFSFVHVYSSNNMSNGTTRNRMLLDRIDLYDKNNSQVSNYSFSYKQSVTTDLLSRDVWGYFNKAECDFQNVETSPGYSDIDILRKIKYPEDGCVVFDFESNTYSYVGDSPVEDFDENIQNWQSAGQETKHFVVQTTTPANYYAPIALNFSTQTQYVDIYPHLTVDDDYNNSMTLSLYKDSQLDRRLMCPNDCSNCKIRVILNGNSHYDLRFSNLAGAPITLDVDLEYIQKVALENEYLFGGGNRIRKISYFDNDVDLSYYGTAQKEVNFDYSFFNNSHKSSGALAYPKPLFTYDKVKRECPYSQNSGPISQFDIEYTVTTMTNNLAAIKTKGADIGYQNVKVFETNNGFKKLIYSNSIDFPEDLLEENLHQPFLPTLNIDYKRGQLMEEHLFDKLGNELKSTVNHYSYEDYIENTGINVFNPNSYAFNNWAGFQNYIDYKYYLDTHAASCFCCFGPPRQFTRSILHKEAYGWVKLDSSVTTEFFYNPTTSSWNPIQTVKNYTYNQDNQKIAVESTTDANGGVLSTEYFYPIDTGMASKPFRNELISRNAIGLQMVVKKYRSASNVYTSTDKLFEKETEYGSFTSEDAAYPLILPKYVYTLKGNTSGLLNKEITFNYDTTGNMIEYTTENGVPTSFVWGYNKTYPVAKLENISYSSISSGILTAIKTSSNSSTSTTAQVATSLNGLRTLPNTLVTSYTYKPLLGVTSVTDPKGDTTTYGYDAFGRLQNVQDKEGNILSENEYHYRTQN